MPVLDTLNQVNQVLTIATTAETVVVPLVKGVVTGVRELFNAGTQTMDYEVVLKVTADDLAEADAKYDEVISKVNAELTRMGKPTI